jgi:hypothetical protein
MDKIKIALKYRNALVLESPVHEASNEAQATSLVAEMMQYGFVASRNLYEVLKTLPEDILVSIRGGLLDHLAELVGADVRYDPFYPNFPQQVMEASECELFFNAILHYWTVGEWRPGYDKLPREVSIEAVQFKEIELISEEDFMDIFTMLLGSKDSISEADKRTIKWFLDNERHLIFPAEIPFKENLCYFAGVMLEKGMDISRLVKTATDVLRVATHLSGGDISLATPTKFKSLPRFLRLELATILNSVVREEDIHRHRNKWVRLFHNLHVGEYRHLNNVIQVAHKVRNNRKLETFNSRLQHALDTKNIAEAVSMLTKRPGEFARRIDHLVRSTPRKKTFVISSFLDIVDYVPTRVLLQVLGNLKTRGVDKDKRIVFPKGNTQKAYILRQEIPRLSVNSINSLMTGIVKSLKNRFAELDPLGKVWIDPELANCPIPTQQRSASEGLFQVARGTRLPIGPKSTLRFFVYWVGQDIDLSASLHDENFGLVSHISYTKLRSQKYQAAHSGDVVSAPAPDGGSEFIDITIDPAAAAGLRYVVMNVFVFSGPTFAEHEKVYAGWMTREYPKSNEIYDPKTVEQKVDLTGDSKNCIPVVFDLVERKAIWADMNTVGRPGWRPNNIKSNRASIAETLEAMVSIDNKVSLYELFKMHAAFRGEIVKDREEADMVFSLDEGITPYDIALINSEYVI